MAKLSGTRTRNKNAAIAQQVERILGKDEVASSNLASSSIESVIPIGMAVFIFYWINTSELIHHHSIDSIMTVTSQGRSIT